MATVDLRTGQARPPRPQDYITKATAVEAGGACPLWFAFLDQVMDSNQELVAYLKRVCGYCLTGITSEHVPFFLYGTGANGKSVFVNTISGVMGDYAVTAPPEVFMAIYSDRHPAELARLRGARLVTASETEIGRRWAESRIKQLTGGEKIAARFMRQEFFEFTPKFKLMISGNQWLEECCIVNPRGFTKSAELFASWKAFAERNGEYVGTAKALSQELQRLGFERGIGGHASDRGFRGLTVRPEAPPNQGEFGNRWEH